MDFDFFLPVNVKSGKDAVKNNADLLKGLGKSCLIVTGGKSAVLSGALDDMKSALESVSISYEVYSKIGPNPRLDHCFEAGVLSREIKADFIIGIGGGSPLDAAKAVAVYASNSDMSQNEIYTKTDRNKALPIVLVGTTAGTGSEVGKVSVLSDPVSGRKKSIAPLDCFPTLTFADPKYTESVPFDTTVSTALDAMAHAVEGYMSPKCSDIPTLFGEKAVSLIFEGLEFLYNNMESKTLPDSSLRQKLYYGSLYAGVTLAYCGTAFPHPLGYILTENYGVPHGKACTLFMDSFIERSEKFESEKLKKLLAIMNTDKDTFVKIIKTLTGFENIRMTEAETENYCSRFETIPNNFTFSPGGFTKSDATALFKEKFLK